MPPLESRVSTQHADSLKTLFAQLSSDLVSRQVSGSYAVEQVLCVINKKIPGPKQLDKFMLCFSVSVSVIEAYFFSSKGTTWLPLFDYLQALESLKTHLLSSRRYKAQYTAAAGTVASYIHALRARLQRKPKLLVMLAQTEFVDAGFDIVTIQTRLTPYLELLSPEARQTFVTYLRNNAFIYLVNNSLSVAEYSEAGDILVAIERLHEIPTAVDKPVSSAELKAALSHGKQQRQNHSCKARTDFSGSTWFLLGTVGALALAATAAASGTDSNNQDDSNGLTPRAGQAVTRQPQAYLFSASSSGVEPIVRKVGSINLNNPLTSNLLVTTVLAHDTEMHSRGTRIKYENLVLKPSSLFSKSSPADSVLLYAKSMYELWEEGAIDSGLDDAVALVKRVNPRSKELRELRDRLTTARYVYGILTTGKSTQDKTTPLNLREIDPSFSPMLLESYALAFPNRNDIPHSLQSRSQMRLSLTLNYLRTKARVTVFQQLLFLKAERASGYYETYPVRSEQEVNRVNLYRKRLFELADAIDPDTCFRGLVEAALIEISHAAPYLIPAHSNDRETKITKLIASLRERTLRSKESEPAKPVPLVEDSSKESVHDTSPSKQTSGVSGFFYALLGMAVAIPMGLVWRFVNKKPQAITPAETGVKTSESPRTRRERKSKLVAKPVTAKHAASAVMPSQTPRTAVVVTQARQLQQEPEVSVSERLIKHLNHATSHLPFSGWQCSEREVQVIYIANVKQRAEKRFYLSVVAKALQKVFGEVNVSISAEQVSLVLPKDYRLVDDFSAETLSGILRQEIVRAYFQHFAAVFCAEFKTSPQNGELVLMRPMSSMVNLKLSSVFVSRVVAENYGLPEGSRYDVGELSMSTTDLWCILSEFLPQLFEADAITIEPGSIRINPNSKVTTAAAETLQAYARRMVEMSPQYQAWCVESLVMR